MVVFVTNCCRNKASNPGPMPAIKRYLDSRIRDVFDASRQAGVAFRIFSGKFGLIEAEEPIPYYDQRLETAHVAQMAEVAAQQLRAIGATEVVFFSRPADRDPGVAPYREAMELACQRAGATLRIEEYR